MADILLSTSLQLCRLCGNCGHHEIDILAPNSHANINLPSRIALRESIFTFVGVRVSDIASNDFGRSPAPRSRFSIIFKFQVEKHGGMTTKICEKCFTKVNDFVQFREICIATDIQLQTILGFANDSGDVDVSDAPPVFASETSNKLLNSYGVPATKRRHNDTGSIETDRWVFIKSTLMPGSRHAHLSLSTPNYRKKRKTIDPQSHDNYPCFSFVGHGSEMNVKTSEVYMVSSTAVYRDHESATNGNELMLIAPSTTNTPAADCIAHDSQQSKPSDTSVDFISLADNNSDVESEDTTAHDIKKCTNESAVGTKKTVKQKAIKSDAQFVVKCRSAGACKDLFESSDAMEYHRTSYHAKGIKKTLCCYLCGRALRNKRNLQLHMIAAHTGLKRFICTFQNCSKAFAQQNFLQLHQNAVHTKMIAFKCPKCTAKFHRKHNLTRHVANIHGWGCA